MTAPCFCHRAPRGFAWHNFTIGPRDRPPGINACSMECLSIISSLKGSPEMPQKTEQRAVEAASEEIGSYLDQIGKTDLAAMTGEEWQDFLLHAFTCTAYEIRNIVAEEVPF